jgi:hypothetical protein
LLLLCVATYIVTKARVALIFVVRSSAIECTHHPPLNVKKCITHINKIPLFLCVLRNIGSNYAHM